MGTGAPYTRAGTCPSATSRMVPGRTDDRDARRDTARGAGGGLRLAVVVDLSRLGGHVGAGLAAFSWRYSTPMLRWKITDPADTRVLGSRRDVARSAPSRRDSCHVVSDGVPPGLWCLRARASARARSR